MDKVPDWITQKAVNFVIKRLKNVDPNTKKKLATALQKEANEYTSANRYYDYNSLVERLETRIPSSMAQSASPSSQGYVTGEAYLSSQPTFVTSSPVSMGCGCGPSAGQTAFQYQTGAATPSAPAYYYETRRQVQTQQVPSSGYSYGSYIQTVPAGCGCSAQGGGLQGYQSQPKFISTTAPAYPCGGQWSAQHAQMSSSGYPCSGSQFQTYPAMIRNNAGLGYRQSYDTFVPFTPATSYGSSYYTERRYSTSQNASYSYTRGSYPSYGITSPIPSNVPLSWSPSHFPSQSPSQARLGFYEPSEYAYRQERIERGNQGGEGNDDDGFLNYSDDERLARRSKSRVSILADGTLLPQAGQRRHSERGRKVRFS